MFRGVSCLWLPLPPGEGWGEGGLLAQLTLALEKNLFENAVEKIEHVRIRKANHTMSIAIQNLSARGVVRFAVLVRSTVEFDDQTSFMTIEVGNIGTHNVFTTKLEAIQLAIAKTSPELLRRRRGV